ncbi:MAG: hypothetical protein AABX14_05135 [Candidatus Aenigmatarchaeota archaeon]
MPKYTVNEKPKYSIPPVLELLPGEIGCVTDVGIYPDCSVLHFCVDAVEKCAHAEVVRNGSIRPVKLSDMRNYELTVLSIRFNIPEEELTELRQAEKEYRARSATS